MRPDRPHQVCAIDAVVNALRSGVKAPLLQLPTGGGKTHIGLRLAEMAVTKARAVGTGRGVLWIACRDELVDQPMKRILEDGWPVEDLAVIKRGRRSGLDTASLTIASIQTLISQPSLAPEHVSLVVFDEARHYIARDWNARLASRYRAVYRIGLDATPQRLDGAPLRDLFDVLITGATVCKLVEAGHLVPSVVIAPTEFQDELAQDPVEAYCRHTPDGRAILFASTVAHAHHYAERFNARGIAAEALDAQTDPLVRAAALRSFTAGETRVLCNVRILTEGTDLPPCDVIIHAAACGSLPDWIQKGGRGLRPAPGKTRCTILDLHGSVHLYGLLDDEHEWSLDGEGKLRDGLPPIAQCPQCFAWGRSARSCTACGNALPTVAPVPPRVKAAELQEVRRRDPETTRRERLYRWAVDARRGGAEGKTLWRIAYRFKGTYGEDAPRPWVEEAIRRACKLIDEEQTRRAGASAGLFARGGA